MNYSFALVAYVHYTNSSTFKTVAAVVVNTIQVGILQKLNPSPSPNKNTLIYCLSD